MSGRWRSLLTLLLAEAAWNPARITQRNPYTMVEVCCEYHGKILEGVGFAKCAPGDEWDAALGIEIARGRAERNLVEQLSPVTQVIAALTKGIAPMLEVMKTMSKVKPRPPSDV